MSYLNRPSGPAGFFRPPSAGFAGNGAEFISGCVTGAGVGAGVGAPVGGIGAIVGAAVGCLAAGGANAYMTNDNVNAAQIGASSTAGPSAQAANLALQQQMLVAAAEEERKKESKKKLWIGLGVGAAVLAIGGVVLATR